MQLNFEYLNLVAPLVRSEKLSGGSLLELTGSTA
jgi:hypothetical protein